MPSSAGSRSSSTAIPTAAAGSCACARPTSRSLRRCSTPGRTRPRSRPRRTDHCAVFRMPFIPHTADDVLEMLATIDVPDIEALFDEIPPELRTATLQSIPPGLTEMEVGRLMEERAARDGRRLNFVGAGAYEHHIPAAIWAIVTRGEFYSAYTPYQAEASQGTLQLLYEYQTMIASLTGMQVANASLYDGASALAEAALMAVRAHRRSQSARILVPPTVSPIYRQVAEAIVGNQSLRFEPLAYHPETGTTQAEDLARWKGEDVTAIVIQ